MNTSDDPDRDVAAILGLPDSAFEPRPSPTRLLPRPAVVAIATVVSVAATLAVVIASPVLRIRDVRQATAAAPAPGLDRLSSMLISPEAPRATLDRAVTSRPDAAAPAGLPPRTAEPSLRVSVMRTARNMSPSGRSVRAGFASRANSVREQAAAADEAAKFTLAEASKLGPPHILEIATGSNSSTADLTRQEPLGALQVRQERFEAVDAIRLLRRK